MTSFDQPPVDYDNTPPKKGWFSRNWKWFVPTIILLPLFCCCGVPLGSYYLFQDQLVMMGPYYIEPLELAKQDAEVERVLGRPIEGKAPETNSFEQGGQAYLSIEFAVTGPDGSGVVSAEFDLSNVMAPEMTRAELVVDGSGQRIDLLREPEAEALTPADGQADEATPLDDRAP